MMKIQVLTEKWESQTFQQIVWLVEMEKMMNQESTKGSENFNSGTFSTNKYVRLSHFTDNFQAC